MKYLINSVMALLFTNVGFTQNIEECRKIVEFAVESINNGSSDNLKPYLSDDFTIAGQKGEIAKLVLNQLFTQLGDKVKSYNEVRHTKLERNIELVYSFDYMKMGTKEATFIFNENNLLAELSLFEMEVKTMKGDAKIEKSSQDIIEIPFTMAGKLIAVKVLLNGEYRTFILDSGAPKVILNSKYITKQDTTRKTFSSTKGVSGSISGMDIENVENLDFYGIQLKNQEVITMDLSHLEEHLKMNFYGLIGYELIKDYDVMFDYKNLKLVLINPEVFGTFKNDNLSNNTLHSLPFNMEGHIPVINAKIGEKEYSYGIDCGAETNLIDESLFESLKENTRQIRRAKLIGADNQPKKIKRGKVKETVIGNRPFKNLITVFNDISHLNEGYKINLDGLIGYEVLSKQITIISFVRKELIFIE